MPLPAILAGGALAGILTRVLLWFFLAKGAAIIIRVMGLIGIAWFTYEWILEPAINLADSYWNAMPPQLDTWMRALGIYEVASIIVSAYVLWAAKKVFLGKKS